MIIEKHFFYILGYARCRSTWFSDFFSTNVSYCYHEMLSGNDDQAFEKYMLNCPITRPYTGSADTNPISFARVKRKPGPMVLIYRPEEDVINSMLKAFDPHPAFKPQEWDQYIRNVVEMTGIVLDWYKETDKNMLKVDFEDLKDEQVLMRVFKHCVPSYDPAWEYIRMRNSRRITLASRDGMKRGIKQSLRNRDKTIEKFKADHLEDYNRQEFYDNFNKPQEPEPEYKHIITPDQYYASATQ